MQWIDNCLICADAQGDYTISTALPDGTLEIRGSAWKKRTRWPKLNSQQQAMRVAERLAQLTAPQEPSPMNYIYLIGPGSAAKTAHDYIARALEQVSNFRRCTQEEYLQRMDDIRTLDATEANKHTMETKMAPSNICLTCGTPMLWEICDVCGGKGHLDVYELDPLWYDPGDVKQCNQCNGDGGWYQCPNYHNHPTKKERTASVTKEHNQ